MEELRLVGCDEGGARFGQTNGPTSAGNFQPSLLRVAASSTLQFLLPLPVGG